MVICYLVIYYHFHRQMHLPALQLHQPVLVHGPAFQRTHYKFKSVAMKDHAR